ncbi:MAG: MFS transporter [Acidimicrobiales bacterium]
MSLLTRGQVRPQSRASTSPTKVLAITCAGVMLASLDLFIVNVALPQIARDLHASGLGELSWVLNAYTIVYASLLVFFGRLADRHRRDLAFLLGVAIFTAASAACAASTSVGMLVAFRVVQAAGAALLTPTSLSLVLASYEPERRHGAVRAWTAMGGLAAAVGPVVGGLLVSTSWRFVFLVNVPIGIAALVVGWRRLPAVPGHPIERPDPAGVVLVTAGVGLLTLGLVIGADWGWTSWRTGLVLAAGAAALAAFAWRCWRARNPLVDPKLFRSREFTIASIIAIFFSAAFGALLLSIVLWEQDGWGWTALHAGLAIAPGPLMVPTVSFLAAGRLIRRYGPAAVMTFGMLAFGAGVAWWALAVTTAPDYVSGVLGGMVLSGVGVGLTLPTMMGTATASLPPQAFATGSAVINMIRQAGIALGVALLVAVLGTSAAHNGVGLAAFQHGWWLTTTLSFAGLVPAAALLHRRRSVLAPAVRAQVLEEVRADAT